MLLPKRLNDGISYTPAGAFNKRIKFKSAGSPDNLGNISEPTVFCECWASVRAIRGQALLKTDQVLQKEYYNVVIRYRAGLDESMIVEINGKDFQIDVMPDPDARKVELHLVCSEADENI